MFMAIVVCAFFTFYSWFVKGYSWFNNAGMAKSLQTTSPELFGFTLNVTTITDTPSIKVIELGICFFMTVLFKRWVNQI